MVRHRSFMTAAFEGKNGLHSGVAPESVVAGLLVRIPVRIW